MGLHVIVNSRIITFASILKLKYDFLVNNSYVLIKYFKQKSYFVLNNEVSTIDLCKEKAIIDHIIELAYQ